MAGRFIQGAMIGFEPWNKQIANFLPRLMVMQKVTKPRITYRFPYKSKIGVIVINYPNYVKLMRTCKPI